MNAEVLKQRPLTGALHADGEPLWRADYEAAEGYRAVRATIGKREPGAVTAAVKEAGLRGRGGAGFPTGVKWGFVPMGDDAPRPKYMIANADEMEPGTFKDRLLIERNPHLLIEGMILAAYAIRAERAIIFLRWAYRRGAAILRRAIAEAQAGGYLGRNILGSGYDLTLELHTSAGRYMCGEETALISSLEGKRANPRPKPPFPPVAGLWGRPTIVNNVETFCNVPAILRYGAEWYGALGSGKDGGTKLFGASGRVRRPGLWELPMGTPLRVVLEEYAGGMQAGYRLRALLPGGASTDFLSAEQIGVALDFDSVAAAGSRLGTGTMIILDDQTCPIGAVLNLMRFFSQESCGWCTPCRDGLPWIVATLEAFEAGEGRPSDLDLLAHHAKFLGPGYTFCPLAPGAMEPLQSSLKLFHRDYEEHIRHGDCPYRGSMPRAGRVIE